MSETSKGLNMKYAIRWMEREARSGKTREHIREFKTERGARSFYLRKKRSPRFVALTGIKDGRWHRVNPMPMTEKEK